jgi:hypothetical protein
MKKCFGIILMLFVFSIASSAAAGQFGPAEPIAKGGKFSLGTGYFFDQRKWEPDKEVSFDEGKSRSNQIYIQGSFGLIRNWEIYGRFASADLELPDWSTHFTADYKPSGTLGIKGVLFPSIDPEGYISIGPFLQSSLGSNYKDSNIIEKTEVKTPWDINFGTTIQVKNEGICFYFGPVVYWQRAKIEVERSSGQHLSATFKEKSNLGALWELNSLFMII